MSNPKMLESQLEKKVVRFCRTHQILTYKFSSPANRGVPDRVLMRVGKVLFLELKRPGANPTRLQLNEIDRIQDAGVTAVWSDDFQEIERYLTWFFNLGS